MGRKKMSRSEIMSKIRSANTSIEKILRAELWKRGIRYRKNCKDVVGKPDICFKKKKIAVFCDSEFWHGKYFMEGKIPKTNQDYWIQKLERNINRDKEVNEQLKKDGWTVLRFWGEEILKDVGKCADKIVEELKK